MSTYSRRDVLGATAVSAAAWAVPATARGDDPVAGLDAEIKRRHDEGVKRLQDWVKQPAIAAENKGMAEGCDLMMRLARDAGFDKVAKVPTDGHPSVFATLDAGAPRTVGLYFMYDVKQVDPTEWSSPPYAAALLDKPGFGKVLMGRGAVNQKGPQAALLAALHAIRGAGRKPPVNLVLVAEGEEEIGSPHFAQVVRRPEVMAALKKCSGVFMPSAGQDPDGMVTVSLGAKGIVELELVASGARWGRGPKKDVHSSNRARLDSPAFHLVQALATLVDAKGDPAIDGFATAARPASAAQKAMLDAAATRMKEATAKKLLSVERWAHDLPWRASLERFLFAPTVNIEGLVAGYTGPGGKTVLPHRAVAKLDLRLVPDMTFDKAVAALKAHLAKRGFGDIEVNPSGGYNPTDTSADAPLIRAQMAVYRRAGLDPILWPRNAGSYPGFVFTEKPLALAAGHFGLGHGSGAHAPDEYYVIESSQPQGATAGTGRCGRSPPTCTSWPTITTLTLSGCRSGTAASHSARPRSSSAGGDLRAGGSRSRTRASAWLVKAPRYALRSAYRSAIARRGSRLFARAAFVRGKRQVRSEEADPGSGGADGGRAQVPAGVGGQRGRSAREADAGDLVAVGVDLRDQRGEGLAGHGRLEGDLAAIEQGAEVGAPGPVHVGGGLSRPGSSGRPAPRGRPGCGRRCAGSGWAAAACRA